MLGVVRAPSLFSITRTSLPSMMATQEFVVPRSIPMTLLMKKLLSADTGGPKHRERPQVECQACMGVMRPGQGIVADFSVQVCHVPQYDITRACPAPRPAR